MPIDALQCALAVMFGLTQAGSPEPLLLAPPSSKRQHSQLLSTQPVMPVAATAQQAAAPHLTTLLLGNSCCCCVVTLWQLDHPQPATASPPLHHQSPALSTSTACIATQAKPQFAALISNQSCINANKQHTALCSSQSISKSLSLLYMCHRQHKQALQEKGVLAQPC